LIARVLDGARTRRFGLIFVSAFVAFPASMGLSGRAFITGISRGADRRKAAQVKPINPKELF
jgi:hypothetical protein